MSACKLTASITKDNCHYTLAGIKDVYLYNHNIDHDYTEDPDGLISAIALDGTEKAYRIECLDNSASFTDELAQNGNGGKYRTHTLNFSVSGLIYNALNQGDALSLGKFTAVVVDRSGKACILGRHNGLISTAYNYESGAADADATGWTVTMVSSEREIAPRLKDEKVITDIADVPVVAP